MTEPRPYRTRTSVLFASNAPKAVILRRGPRSHYRLVAWNTDDDTFKPGQWMKGNVRLCDLSPTGKMLLYFAEQFHPRATSKVTLGPYDPFTQTFTKYPRPLVRPGRKVPRYMRRPSEGQYGSAPRKVTGSWTAISAPPYFSALAIWPSIGRWTGGGVFKSERDVVINESGTGITPIENVAIPSNVRISSGGRTRSQTTSAYQPTPAETERHAGIAAALQQADLLWVDWISLRHGRDLLFAGDGRIFRLRDYENIAEDRYLASARALVDLRDMTFEQLRPPPGAMRW
jgi:hypothetical protein